MRGCRPKEPLGTGTAEILLRVCVLTRSSFIAFYGALEIGCLCGKAQLSVGAAVQVLQPAFDSRYVHERPHEFAEASGVPRALRMTGSMSETHGYLL